MSSLEQPQSSPQNPYSILDYEQFWRDHYDWLKEKGYLLRPRYRPNWVPSWTGTSKIRLQCEDGCVALHPRILDAVRARDGAFVMLRQADSETVSDELKMGRLFSNEPICSDPRNHCVTVSETLQIPDDEEKVIVVMPLFVSWTAVPFVTFGEVVNFFDQIFEGLQFMHSLHVAHNDVKDNNIMMDWTPLFDIPPHPMDESMKRDWSGAARPRRNRTTHPVRYHFIDYDLTEQYNPEDGPALHVPGYGGDRSVPEFVKNEPCNPFAVDVYCLGNMIRQSFIVGNRWSSAKRGFEFMHQLVADMTQDDPVKRPTMDEVVARFKDIRRGLSQWKLRSRIASKNEFIVARIFRTSFHWTRQLFYMAKRTPAIPAASR